MKPPKNFYNAVDQRKLGLEDGLLPDVTAADNGKILKVSNGKWGPGDDENTIIEANPDEQPTVDLENLKIGDTVYSVKNPELTSIKSFKLTMSNGGQYNTNKPIIEFFNEAGQEASITSSDYTVECDKTYAGNAGMDQVCSIQTPETPGTFTYTFVNDFDIDTYKLIKLTRGGTFVNDIAKNIKIELSADGENYLTIYDETTITWSDAVSYHLISLKDGSEASTLLPIVTSSDNGKVLGVVGGVWGKTSIPSLPEITSGANGRFIYTLSSRYTLSNYPILSLLRASKPSGSTVNVTFFPTATTKFSEFLTNNRERFFVLILFDDDSQEFYYIHSVTKSDGTITIIFKNGDGSHTVTFSGSTNDSVSSGTYT